MLLLQTATEGVRGKGGRQRVRVPPIAFPIAGRFPNFQPGKQNMKTNSTTRPGAASPLLVGSRTKAVRAHNEEEHLRSEVTYLLKQGWSPVVEHCAPSKQGQNPWYLWKLPEAGQHNVDVVVDQLHACHTAFPHHDIRLVGYDNNRRGQGTGLTVYRAA